MKTLIKGFFLILGLIPLTAMAEDVILIVQPHASIVNDPNHPYNPSYASLTYVGVLGGSGNNLKYTFGKSNDCLPFSDDGVCVIASLQVRPSPSALDANGMVKYCSMKFVITNSPGKFFTLQEPIQNRGFNCKIVNNQTNATLFVDPQ